jgi:hypothetical protein
MHQLEPTAPATAFVPASVFLQRLHYEAPTDHFILGWLMSRMHKRSFGLIMTQNRMPWLLEIDGRCGQGEKTHKAKRVKIGLVTGAGPKHPGRGARLDLMRINIATGEAHIEASQSTCAPVTGRVSHDELYVADGNSRIGSRCSC